MPKFTVYEIWTRATIIEADTEDDALLNYEPKPMEGLNLCNWHAVPHWGASKTPKTEPKITPVKSLLLMLLCLFVPLSALAQDKPSLKLAQATFIAANAADLGSTAWALHSGNGREANPLGGVGVRPVLYKTATTGLVLWLTAKMGNQHPTAAKVSLYVLSGITGSIALHNSQVARGR